MAGAYRFDRNSANMDSDVVRQKVEQLAAVLKEEGLWKKSEPEWVNDYNFSTEMPEVDFFEWLQFVYLPNRLLNHHHAMWTGNENLITLQVRKFASEKITNKHLVRLLVELDAL